MNSLSGILEALSCRFNQPNTRKQGTDISTQLHKINQILTIFEKCCSRVQGRQVLTALRLVDTAPASPPATPTPTTAPRNTKKRSERAPRRTVEQNRADSRTIKNLRRRRGGRRTTAGWPRGTRPGSSCSGRRRPAAAPPSWPGVEGRGAGRGRWKARRRAPCLGVGRRRRTLKFCYFPTVLLWIWCSWPLNFHPRIVSFGVSLPPAEIRILNFSHTEAVQEALYRY